MFLNPNLNSNCSNLLDMKNLQEQVQKSFCYQKLFWPFTVWINCSSELKKISNFKFLAYSLEFQNFCSNLLLTWIEMALRKSHSKTFDDFIARPFSWKEGCLFQVRAERKIYILSGNSNKRKRMMFFDCVCTIVNWL